MSYKKIHAFGLDISDYSVELVLLNKKRNVELYQRETLPFGVVVNGRIKDKQALEKILLKIKKNLGKKLFTDKVILSLPENKVFARVFNVPTLLINNPKVILQLAQEHIPLDINESIFDYKIIKDKTLSKKERKIYFVATEEKLVFDYLEILKLAEFQPIAIDVEPSSIARALEDPEKEILQEKLAKKLKEQQKKMVKKQQKAKKENAKKTKNKQEETEKIVEEIVKQELPFAEIALDVGAKHSVVTVFYNTNVFPSISIPIGGHTFSQIIQKTFKTENFEEAQKIKNKLTLESVKYKKLQNDFEAEESKIIKEVQSLIHYFEKNNQAVVKTLHLSGGTSKTVGFLQYLQENLDIEVKRAEPHVGHKAIFETELYVNAIGLALRGICKDPVTKDINLLPAPQKQLLVEQQAKAVVIYSSLVILFISSLLLASFNIVLSNFYFDLDGLEKTNASFQRIVEGTRYKEIQQHLQDLNDSVQLAKQVQQETYLFQDIRNYFYANIPNTIVINQFHYNQKQDIHKINLSGFALSREKILTLQNSLKNTPFYYNLVAPLSNLLKHENIYFSFSFELDLIKFKEYLVEQAATKQAEDKKPKDSLSEENNIMSQDEIAASVDSTNSKNTEDNIQNEFSNILDEEEMLMQEDDLTNLQIEISKISNSIQENIQNEDQQIEEILHSSQSEYPFQEKIHEKVGNIFIIEEKFYSDTAEEKSEQQINL